MCDIFGSFFFIVTQNWPQGPFAQITSQTEGHSIWTHGSPYVFRNIPWMFFTAYMFTLNCLSGSQYLACCRPHKYIQLRGSKCVKLVLPVIWLLASLQIAIPVIVLACLSTMPTNKAFKYLILISKIEMVSWMVIYIISTFISITFNTLIYKELKRIKQRSVPGSKLPDAVSNPRGEHETLVQSSKVKSHSADETLVQSDQANTHEMAEAFPQSGWSSSHENETLYYTDANTQTDDVIIEISQESCAKNETIIPCNCAKNESIIPCNCAKNETIIPCNWDKSLTIQSAQGDTEITDNDFLQSGESYGKDGTGNRKIVVDETYNKSDNESDTKSKPLVGVTFMQ